MTEYDLYPDYMREVIYYQDVYISSKDLSVDEVMEALKNYYDSYVKFLVSPYLEDYD